FSRALDARVARLAGMPAGLELPTDRLRPAALSFSGARMPLRLAGPVMEGAGALARAGGTTIEVVVLAALAVLMHRYAGVSDVVIGTPWRSGPAGVVGPLTNLLVARIDVSGNPSFQEVIAAVR